jgi:hypothetical protein
MPEIRLQFVAARDIGSSLIRWFSAGPFSHVDAIVDEAALRLLEPGTGGAMPAGAVCLVRPGWLFGSRSDRVGGQPPGVQIRPPGYATFSRRVVATIPATEAQLAGFWRFQRAQLGKPYDSTAIWGFAAGRDWRETDSWYCSEDQARALEPPETGSWLDPNKDGAGIFPEPLYLAANKVTPVALALAISATPAASFTELAT